MQFKPRAILQKICQEIQNYNDISGTNGLMLIFLNFVSELLDAIRTLAPEADIKGEDR